MKTKKVLLWVFTFLPLIVTLIVLPVLPDTIPAHFGLGGEVDRWGSKYEALITPLITIASITFMDFIGRYAKKESNSAAQNEKVLAVTNFVIAFMFNGLTYWFLYSAYINAANLYKTDIDMMKITAIIMSISYIFLGNILPKCKQNLVVGIRTKWTLGNETVWYKTHRLGGRAIMIFGVVSTILCLTVLNNMIAFLAVFVGLVLIAILIMVYSYVIYKRMPNNS